MFATATMGQVEFQASVTPGRICKVSQNSSGGSQAVGTILSDTVTVVDCNGYPVPGASVALVPGAGSGSVSASPVITNSAGQAFITWTLGTSTAFSVQTLTATASGKADPYNAGLDPTFSASNQRAVSVVAGAANSIAAITPVPAASQTYSSSNPITVVVKDQYGNVVSGQVVSFTASGGGATAGTASPSSATTDAGGIASAVWTLGTNAPGVGSFTNTITITAGAAQLGYTVSGHP
jgi:hypothetical protein